MSFGGFGQNNNNQTTSGFGGFGSSNPGGTGGFGSSGTSGFGSSTNTGGGLFGGGNTGGFGTGGGFGANTSGPQSSPFGGAATKPFGQQSSTTGGGLFGGTTATAGTSGGFGGFGANNQTSSSPFGGGGGLFGANKPAFGTTGTTGTGLFGTGTGGVAGFGTSNNAQTGAFGAPAATAFTPGNLQSEGTGSTPFQPVVEKDTGTNQTNHFQSITMMPPYQKFSFEELRLADYSQGRRYGNASNQPGAFGTNTGFVAFGTTNTGTGFGGGGFGAGNNAVSSFGANTQNTNAFGTNTGGTNLFGAKPFGQTNNTATSAQPSGGLFGTTPATGTTGFGGGTLFGSATNNNQTGGLNFGGGGTTGGIGFGTAGNTGGFGAANTGGGLFGGGNNAAGTSTTPFGAGQQPQQANPSPFAGFGQAQGQNQQNQNATPAFGTSNQTDQTKQGGLFGTAGTNTTGGAFALGTNQATQGTNTFNLGANNNTGGGLFGKSANQTTTPFGALSNNQNATGNNAGGNIAFGGFGLNPQNQQNQGGGLLGNNQNQQKPGGLFGNFGNNANNTGNAFGNLGKTTDNQQTGGGLFGVNNQNPQQPSGAGSLFGNPSLFGGAQQNQQQAQQPLGLSTSINDIDPFGSVQLFNGLALPTAQNTGPIATPLSSAQKLKKSTIIPQYKINPSASSRLITPQSRGYGFSYSTYGSPSGISSAMSTPVGLNSSLLGSSIGRTLGKSLSTSNLRRTFDADDSVLAAGAFSTTGNRYYNGGSLKRLVINRGLRSDLFSPPNDVSGALPAPDKNDRTQQVNGSKKRVSFDAKSSGGDGGEGANESAQVNGSGGSPKRQNGSSASPNGDSTNGTVESDENTVRGNELAVVHEDGTPPQPNKSARTGNGSRNPRADKKMGEYWMSPSKEELQNMSREDLQHVNGLKIGRRGCGFVEFKAPVDLTTIDLDNIYDNIVVIVTRSCTVYPDESVKPAVGKGLNVPARITLENSWPRSDRGRRDVLERSGSRYEKHLIRLKRVAETHFESYDPETGTWIFTVDHFTTYGIDYDDEEDSIAGSGLSALSNTPQPPSKSATVQQSHGEDVPMNSDDESDTSFNPDDTFEFRKRKLPPGSFDEQEPYGDNSEGNDGEEGQSMGQSFFGERSMGSSSRNGVNEPNEVQGQGDATGKDESVTIRDKVMVGSYPDVDHTMEPSEKPLQKESLERGSLVSLLASNSKLNLQRSQLRHDTPVKTKLQLGDDWVEHLERTISPRKQDRRALRELQENVLQDDVLENSEATPQARTETISNERSIHTSIDLMHSLFGQDHNRKREKVKDRGRVANAGFEWPYHKRSKGNEFSDSSMDSKDKAFHQSIKPHWGPRGTLIYAMPSSSPLIQSRRGGSDHPERALLNDKGALVSQGKDVRFASLNAGNPSTKMLEQQKHCTRVNIVDDVPFAKLHSVFEYEEFMNSVDGTEPHQIYEKLVWELASCLFDYVYDKPKDINQDIEEYIDNRLRKDRLTAFWAKLIHDSVRQQILKAKSKEEEAIYHLSAHQIEDACACLIDGRDYRLATLVAMIGGDDLMRQDMREQIDEWRRLKVLPEISEPMRAIYELLAGNTCVCEGLDGPPEDRARTFVISERFGLGWKQAFGLRLWYGIKQEEPIAVAVQRYLEDLNAHKEDYARPVPWFVEQRIPTMWEDRSLQKREDLFWGILKLYSEYTERKKRYSVEDILMPENYQLNPMDYQLTWQLYHAFHCMQIAEIRPEIDAPYEPSPKVARLTRDFASQLEIAGHWTWSIFVVLHLLDTNSRTFGIQRLLAEHGGEIGDGPEDQIFKLLIEDYMIPQGWIWEAKALYARSVTQDHVKETEYLLKARNWEHAHETIVQNVAPRAVIENERGMLQKLLDGFQDVKIVGRWNLGGQVYMDYLRFLQIREQDEEETDATMMDDGEQESASKRRDERGLPPRDDYEAVVSRLLAALPAMMHQGDRKLGFYESVAVQEMSNVVAEALLDEENEELGIKAQLLSLPLTEDSTLKHTVQLSVEYYKAVMMGGK